MSLNVKIAVYRGTRANLSSLATTGQQGVLAWTTDTNEFFVDSGSGTGIGAGNAWLPIVTEFVGVNSQSGTSYTVVTGDRGKVVKLANAAPIAVTLPQATAESGAFPLGWSAEIYNGGAGLITITPTTSTINGGSTITVASGSSITIVSDGTNYIALTGKTSINVTNAVTHQFATSNNADGSLNLAQPAFTDITGSITQAQLPASIGAGSNLSSIDCGTF